MRHCRGLPVGSAVGVAAAAVGEVVDATRVTVGVLLVGPIVDVPTVVVGEVVYATRVTVDGCLSAQQSMLRQRTSARLWMPPAWPSVSCPGPAVDVATQVIGASVAGTVPETH